jgi:hypothetical protein
MREVYDSTNAHLENVVRWGFLIIKSRYGTLTYRYVLILGRS